MNLTFPIIVLSNLIIFFAFYTRSLLGFGGALISVPLLAFLFPLKFAVPLEAIFEVILSLMLVRGEWKKMNRQILIVLLIGSFIGTLVGTYVLKSLTNIILLKILGVVIILFSLNLLRAQQSKVKTPFSLSVGLIAGIIAGILGGMFGTSGPPIVLFLAYQIKDKDILRATLIGFFTVDFAMRLMVFGLSGFINQPLLYMTLLLIPGLIFGIFLGKNHFVIVDEKLYKKGVITVLVLSGLLLLIK